MARFFSFFNYDKEGPGVYLNEAPKGPFKTFFGILGRKFWNTVTINMMYVVFSIPIFLFAILAAYLIFPQVFPSLTLEFFEKILPSDIFPSSIESVSNSLSELSSGLVSGALDQPGMTAQEGAAIIYTQIMMVLSFALIGMQLFVFGPVHAGITFLLRNYAREEHAFLWGDFKEHAKKNWKQSLITSFFGILGVIIIFTNYSFYTNGDIIQNNFLRGVFQGGIILIFLIFAMMQMYIYPMMVTFKLNLKQMYKNALLFVLARLPFNIGIGLVTLLLTGVIPFLLLFVGGFGLIVLLFYYLFLAFGLNLLVTNFFVYRQLKKYMIDPYEAEQAKEKDSDKAEEKAIFKDTNPVDQ